MLVFLVNVNFDVPVPVYLRIGILLERRRFDRSSCCGSKGCECPGFAGRGVCCGLWIHRSCRDICHPRIGPSAFALYPSIYLRSFFRRAMGWR